MENQIFGRKAGSGKDMICLIRGDGASGDGKPIDPGVTDESVVTSTRHVVKLLQEEGVKGYVLFEGDPTPCELVPDADSVYPAIID